MLCFFVKEKTAYDMRISDWSSDVCSSDLRKVYDEFSEPARGTAKWEGLFPDVRQLRLESTLIRLNGVRLDKATFTVRPIRTAAGSEYWRVDLSSSQSAGTIFRRAAQGKRAGSIREKLERLALGCGSADAGPTQDIVRAAWWEKGC